MKKTVLILIFGIVLFSCSSAKSKQNKIKYFNEQNINISKSKFYQKKATNKFLVIPSDSINYKRLVLREARGEINDRKEFELIFKNELNQDLDSNKPIVIIYYPGKDPCNSNGATDKKWIQNWYEQLEEGLNQVAQVKPMYIYKENDGLEKYNGILDWKKDPDGMIERLFFQHHYPCMSFVVISKEGKYISYFGEFSKEYVWEATQLLKE